MNPLRRRLGAAATGVILLGGTALGAIAVSVATSTSASALPTNTTYNDNGCTNNIQPNSPPGASLSTIPIGLGSDQTDAALANTVDPVTGLTIPGGVTVTNAPSYTASTGVVVGGSGQVTNVASTGFVSAGFLQAGVNLGVITIGQHLSGDLNVLIDAGGGATFPASQPAGVTQESSTQVLATGTGNGTIVGNAGDHTGGPHGTVTAPLAVTAGMPNINYTAPAVAGTAFFYQDNSGAVTNPGGGGGDFDGTNSTFPAGDASAQLAANIGIATAYIACQPGVTGGVTPTQTYTQATPSTEFIFAAVNVAAAQAPTPGAGPFSITVNLGGSGHTNVAVGATDNVPIQSVTVSSPATSGNAVGGTCTVQALSNADCEVTYTNTANAASDSFNVQLVSSGGNSVDIPVSVTIIAHPSVCDVTAQPSCTLAQIVEVPVTGADLSMAQATGLPEDVLNHTLNNSLQCVGAAITLNGQPQLACGAMFPVTVTNARGTDAGWTLTGQVSDFLDGVAPAGTTCDTIATYTNHCIPGGNLVWDPVAGVAHGIVPGDTAEVTPGAPILSGLAVQTPSLAQAAALHDLLTQTAGQALAAFGVQTQTNPVTEVSPPGGLHNGAQTLCVTTSGQSGGTFVCGAGLVVAVPASAAANFGADDGYEATLTLTLA